MIIDRAELNQLTLERTLNLLSYVLTTQQNAIFAKMKHTPIRINAMKSKSNPA
jgi:hypothetical protein